MKTRLAFSTISYNTVSFLQLKLEELRSACIVTFWAFVQHEPEDDEAGNKKHCHVWVLPNKSVDTDSFLANFLEPDFSKPDKPLKCLSARSSKVFADWYMYAIHDAAYLISKGQTRRYHYSESDFLTSDNDDLHRFICEIDLLSQSPYARMIEAMKDGISFDDYFRRGSVPIPQIRQFEYAWNLVMRGKTHRNKRKGHENDRSAVRVIHARRHYKFFFKRGTKR